MEIMFYLEGIYKTIDPNPYFISDRIKVWKYVVPIVRIDWKPRFLNLLCLQAYYYTCLQKSQI